MARARLAESVSGSRCPPSDRESRQTMAMRSEQREAPRRAAEARSSRPTLKLDLGQAPVEQEPTAAGRGWGLGGTDLSDDSATHVRD